MARPTLGVKWTAPDIQWQKSLGGSDYDGGWALGNHTMTDIFSSQLLLNNGDVTAIMEMAISGL